MIPACRNMFSACQNKILHAKRDSACRHMVFVCRNRFLACRHMIPAWPDHHFCMPKHESACRITIPACQNAILHAETRFCMSKHGRGPRWSQPGPRRAPAGARWPHGGEEDVSAVLGQHTKRLCFTSPGGTREPAGPVVPPLIFH